MVELAAHQAPSGRRGEVRTVHHLWIVMFTNAAPMRDARCAVLVAARVSAVWVSQAVPNKDGEIGFKYILVHDDAVADFIFSKVNEVVVILAVVVDDLLAAPEFIEDLGAKQGADLGLRVFPV